jgi:hypothetical protein
LFRENARAGLISLEFLKQSVELWPWFDLGCFHVRIEGSEGPARGPRPGGAVAKALLEGNLSLHRCIQFRGVSLTATLQQ